MRPRINRLGVVVLLRVPSGMPVLMYFVQDVDAVGVAGSSGLRSPSMGVDARRGCRGYCVCGGGGGSGSSSIGGGSVSSVRFGNVAVAEQR